MQSLLDIEPTVTLQNRLFLVRKLITNKLIETFEVMLPKKACFCLVLCRVKTKKANKNRKQRNLSSFINSLILLTMLKFGDFTLLLLSTARIGSLSKSLRLVLLRLS